MATPFAPQTQQMSFNESERLREERQRRDELARKRRRNLIAGAVSILFAIALVVAAFIWLWTTTLWNPTDQLDPLLDPSQEPAVTSTPVVTEAELQPTT